MLRSHWEQPLSHTNYHERKENGGDGDGDGLAAYGGAVEQLPAGEAADANNGVER